MKKFAMVRHRGSNDRYYKTTIVELSLWDIVRLLFGREIAFFAHNEPVIVRAVPGYRAFNINGIEGCDMEIEP